MPFGKNRRRISPLVFSFVGRCHGEALAQAGVDPSAGTVSDSYDNALAETVNGPYKTELIYPRRPWEMVGKVEIAPSLSALV